MVLIITDLLHFLFIPESGPPYYTKVGIVVLYLWLVDTSPSKRPVIFILDSDYRNSYPRPTLLSSSCMFIVSNLTSKRVSQVPMYRVPIMSSTMCHEWVPTVWVRPLTKLDGGPQPKPPSIEKFWCPKRNSWTHLRDKVTKDPSTGTPFDILTIFGVKEVGELLLLS